MQEHPAVHHVTQAMRVLESLPVQSPEPAGVAPAFVDTLPLWGGGTTMAKKQRGNTRPSYPPEFRRRMVELVRGGRTPEALSREFGPTAQSIRHRARQADLDEGRRTDGLTTEEREELVRLRRENRTLREEREILRKAAAWFAQETTKSNPPKRSGS